MGINENATKSVQASKPPRQSVTFTPEIYAELERLSKEKCFHRVGCA